MNILPACVFVNCGHAVPAEVMKTVPDFRKPSLETVVSCHVIKSSQLQRHLSRPRSGAS